MTARIKPSSAHGCVKAPPSKSYAHRLLICSALSAGECSVFGVSQSEDMKATLDCISALGVGYTQCGDTVTVHSGAKSVTDNTVFSCRESGSTLRFMLPIALVYGQNVIFKGSRRLIERGIGIYETLFKDKGITITKSADTISVSGKLTGSDFTLRGDVSSQFVSGLLFALPLLDSDSTIHILEPVESRKYIDITIDAIRKFGVEIKELPDNTFYIKGNQSYRPADLSVEGDWSNAAALFALNHAGSDITVTGLNADSLQGDRICLELFEKLNDEKPVIDISDCPDLGPVLFAVAAIKHGAVFVGTRRLRIKESDRAKSMADELIKLGIKTQIDENQVIIYNNKLTPPTEPLHGHNDHRIVMAMTVLSSITGGVIEDAQAISKSYPDFFDVLRALHLEVENEA